MEEQIVDSLFLFNELKKQNSIQEIANKIGLHMGTLKRWLESKKVPNNYFNDLNFLLGNKYTKPKIINNVRNNDQFYTTREISQYCYDKLLDILNKLDINHEQYIFIEPSAGCGHFYDILPKNKRIGIDIDPKNNKELLKNNYLNFMPDLTKKYIVFGNPPFGLRGNLALRFINHSEKFADIVAFILPPLFDSDGKGVPKKRVLNYELAHTEKLPLDSFIYPDGKKVEVATIFQIWTKVNKEKIQKSKKDTCKDYIKVYSLSDGGTPSSTRNKKMLNKCDVYLPSTCFKGMKAYDKFENLPNKRGYGIVIYRNKEELKELFYNLNWAKIAFLSTNSALNLRTSIIEQEIIKKGFKDEYLY